MVHGCPQTPQPLMVIHSTEADSVSDVVMMCTSDDSIPTLEDGPLRPETLPPFGFKHNRGRDFIPFIITDDKGNQWPAHYTQLVKTSDLFIITVRHNSPYYYGQYVHTTPQYNTDEVIHYNEDDLIPLRASSIHRIAVDISLEAIKDTTLTMEVHHYRVACGEELRLQCEIAWLQAGLTCVGSIKQASHQCLELAHVMDQIEIMNLDSYGHHYDVMSVVMDVDHGLVLTDVDVDTCYDGYDVISGIHHNVLTEPSHSVPWS
ncbi:hypothetical protein EDB89DRAFT_1912882 [Lactarius sanguifluus]|nr:hypothetical protein EDB89DRAFT_1912882 [Lactarius sanguifluus]